jgi:hypothetical protein
MPADQFNRIYQRRNRAFDSASSQRLTQLFPPHSHVIGLIRTDRVNFDCGRPAVYPHLPDTTLSPRKEVVKFRLDGVSVSYPRRTPLGKPMLSARGFFLGEVRPRRRPSWNRRRRPTRRKASPAPCAVPGWVAKTLLLKFHEAFLYRASRAGDHEFGRR